MSLFIFNHISGELNIDQMRNEITLCKRMCSYVPVLDLTVFNIIWIFSLNWMSEEEKEKNNVVLLFLIICT